VASEPRDSRGTVDGRAGTDDVDWIPEVSSRGWIVVARDKKTRLRPAEWAVLAAYPLRMLVLTTVGNLDVWEQLRVFVARWDRIEELSTTPGAMGVCRNEERTSEMEHPRL